MQTQASAVISALAADEQQLATHRPDSASKPDDKDDDDLPPLGSCFSIFMFALI